MRISSEQKDALSKLLHVCKNHPNAIVRREAERLHHELIEEQEVNQDPRKWLRFLSHPRLWTGSMHCSLSSTPVFGRRDRSMLPDRVNAITDSKAVPGSKKVGS